MTHTQQRSIAGKWKLLTGAQKAKRHRRKWERGLLLKDPCQYLLKGALSLNIAPFFSAGCGRGHQQRRQGQLLREARLDRRGLFQPRVQLQAFQVRLRGRQGQGHPRSHGTVGHVQDASDAVPQNNPICPTLSLSLSFGDAAKKARGVVPITHIT